MAKDRDTEIKDTAADGLDPGDALTPEEALARVLVLLKGETVEQGYESGDIRALLAFERGDVPAEEVAARGLIRGWAPC
jgi:hypothetical protein